MKATRVYILGAGCSACGEYPIASEVRTRLEEFARNNLQNDSSKELRRCVEQTCQLMAKHGVDTTDQLAQALEEERRREIEESKKAMSALFFSLEQQATQKALPNYAAFFEELFEQGDDPDLEKRLATTNCRVLTYNYDRLFERTFIEWVKRHLQDPQESVQNAITWLNSGLKDQGSVTFEEGVFSLVKLHGGIGQFYRNRDYGLNHVYPFDLNQPLPPIADDPYFEIPKQKSNQQTIFYPRDKMKIVDWLNEENTNQSSMRNYEKAVWRKAMSECATATEIQIIGYSMQSIDWFWFKHLFKEAKHCKKIVVRNRHACLNHLIEKMERLGGELGMSWKVEGRAENFFGKTE